MGLFDKFKKPKKLDSDLDEIKELSIFNNMKNKQVFDGPANPKLIANLEEVADMLEKEGNWYQSGVFHQRALYVNKEDSESWLKFAQFLNRWNESKANFEPHESVFYNIDDKKMSKNYQECHRFANYLKNYNPTILVGDWLFYDLDEMLIIEK